MQAKKVFEAQNFERGLNPKKALDLGGISLFPLYQKRQKKLENDRVKLLKDANEDWDNFLKKTFVGKTITAHLKTMPSFDKQGNMHGKTQRGEFTIKVQDVIAPSSSNEGFLTNTIIFADMDNNIYALDDLNQKIYIE